MKSLSTHDIKFDYGGYKVLDGIDLEIRPGEILGILGPNGCGKTTLLRNLNKNLEPHHGCVMLEEKDFKEMSKNEVARNIAVVPQTNEIRFSFTVKDIVTMGRMPFQKKFDAETRDDLKIIDDAMEKTGLTKFAERHINTMSGGERQRVMIARALAQTPEILLMDEPTLHLDVSMQFDALNLVYNLSREMGLTVVIVSHDIGMVARYCDRIVMLHDHRIHCVGTPKEVLTPENMRVVFNIDAELYYDEKIGRNSVIIHNSFSSKMNS